MSDESVGQAPPYKRPKVVFILFWWAEGRWMAALDAASRSAWLHRKGAAPADAPALAIPGTRGSLSYLVIPTGDQRRNAWSLAHGAGRCWNRQSAKARLKDRYRADSLVRTELGGAVICEDKNLLYEEAPQAYKDIDSVIADMVEMGLIRVVATLKPLITYKVRRSSG